MPNTKSAKKRMNQNEKRRKINLARKTSIKTVIKNILSAIESGEKVDKIKELMVKAESELARAKNKILHSNTSSNKISSLARKVASYIKQQQKQS